MFFKQFYLESLGHASYLVGDEATGQALVLDPRRDVEGYFEAARKEGLRIAYAIDSHGHNDYLTGLCELGARQRVELLGYAGAGLGYEHRQVKDGEIIEVGDVGFEFVHTPGHTPEHVSLLVYDRTAGDEPALMLSGGALLVGDLARPDLLGGTVQAREAAREFCHTIQEKILWRLPDHVEVWPTHVSGSLCGGNIGSRLSTTIGYERKTNVVLSRVSSSEEFVDECIRIDNLPAVPPYWRRMRAQNLAGPPLLGVLGEPPAMQTDEVESRFRSGAVLLDTRSVEAFWGAHIPGALNVALGASFSTWAGTVLEEGAEVLLVLDSPSDLWDATWQLLRIGYPPPIGWLSGGMHAWRTSGRPTESIPQMTVQQVAEEMDEGVLEVLDVRQPSEWAEGHIEGATYITGAELPERLDEVPTSKRVAVLCGSGFRSSVATSYLLAHDHPNAVNVSGGMGAWRASGLPTTADVS
ncbi:MAG: rhodanese-like domain-containing protein [Actinomycetota bacterium]|nr:rhodanese-like domain-containing protein [Actinomycetota bacterium]